MFQKSVIASAFLLATTSAWGQAEVAPTVEPIAPLPVAQAAPAPAVVLPANTEILLSMNQEVTTKGKQWDEGDTFDLSVVHDVMFGNYVVIPKGSRGVGEITWLTSKGAFGKSGKMDIELRYVEVGGRRIPISGSFRQEGEGNTVATVGGVVLAGVFAGFITGKSGRIPQGRELKAHTKEDLPLALSGPPPSKPVAALPVKAVAPVPAVVTTAAESQPVVQPVSATTEAVEPAQPTAE